MPECVWKLLQRARPELREAQRDAATDRLDAVEPGVEPVRELLDSALGIGGDAAAKEVDLRRGVAGRQRDDGQQAIVAHA